MQLLSRKNAKRDSVSRFLSIYVCWSSPLFPVGLFHLPPWGQSACVRVGFHVPTAVRKNEIHFSSVSVLAGLCLTCPMTCSSLSFYIPHLVFPPPEPHSLHWRNPIRDRGGERIVWFFTEMGLVNCSSNRRPHVVSYLGWYSRHSPVWIPCFFVSANLFDDDSPWCDKPCKVMLPVVGDCWLVFAVCCAHCWLFWLARQPFIVVTLMPRPVNGGVHLSVPRPTN